MKNKNRLYVKYLTLIQLTLIALKVTNIINWSWGVVMMPIGIPLCCTMALASIIFTSVFPSVLRDEIKYRIDKIKGKKESKSKKYNINSKERVLEEDVVVDKDVVESFDNDNLSEDNGVELLNYGYKYDDSSYKEEFDDTLDNPKVNRLVKKC